MSKVLMTGVAVGLGLAFSGAANAQINIGVAGPNIDAVTLTAVFGGIATMITASRKAAPSISKAVIAVSKEVRCWLDWIEKRCRR